MSVCISCEYKALGVELVTITLDSGILKEEAKTIETAEGKSVILPSGDNLWSPSGYTFSGWAETATGIDRYKAGDKCSSTKSITLYATWAENMVTLSYNANGGEETGEIKSATVAKGTEVTLDNGGTLSRDGFVFSGWTDGKTNYEPGSKLSLNEDIKLYALWTEKPNIKYYSEGTLIAIEYLQNNSAKIGNGNGLSKEGEALYWTTGSDCTGTRYKVGDNYIGTQSLILYAQWDTVEIYDIGYVDGDDADEATGNPAEYTRYTIATNNNKPIVISGAPTRAGYIFKGWKDEFEKDDTKATRTYIIDAETYGEINLEAVWEKEEDIFITYAITYEIGSDATAAAGNPEEYIRYTEATIKNEPIVISGAPTRPGYLFNGWKLSGKTNDTAVVPYTIDATTTGNIKLEAVWYRVERVGDVIRMGTYPSDTGVYAGRSIEWECIYYDGTNKRALMISEKLLGEKVFDYYSDNYVDSSIHSYLTNEEEKAFIKTYSIDTSIMIGVNAGVKNTIKTQTTGSDKLFLLSKEEVEECWPYSGNRQAPDFDGENRIWWLRSKSIESRGCVYSVRKDGSIYEQPIECTSYIRPAFWLSLD